MCGRVKNADPNDLKSKLHRDIKIVREYYATGNVPPGALVDVIADYEPTAIHSMLWSVVPSYSAEFKPNYKYATFNAKKETLLELPTWKKLIGKKHCVIVTDGFYEWNYELPEKKKGPHIYEIKAANEPFTFMAGLYEDWVDKSTGEIKRSCTMITNPANELMSKIHNTKARMPAFLKQDQLNLWIDNDLPINERLKLIEPVGSEFLEAIEIEKINS
jgi:putative SOS response-associated peptidase YedK